MYRDRTTTAPVGDGVGPALTCRSGAGRRLGAASAVGLDDGRRDLPSRPGDARSVRAGGPSVGPAEPAGPLEFAQEEQSLTWRSDQCAPRSGCPHRKAVRLAASSGVRPRLDQASGRSAASPGRRRGSGAVGRAGAAVEPGPGATAEGTAGAAQDEARRDGRPCPRDPRGTWPAMTQRVPAPFRSRPVGPVRSAHVPAPGRRTAMTRRSGGARYLRAGPARPIARLGARCGSAGSSSGWSAAALVAGWAVAAGLVLLAYRPGRTARRRSSALTMVVPDRDRRVRAWSGRRSPAGPRAFAGMVWLGIGALLCLIPSILGRRRAAPGARARRRSLPSLEAAYPWLLALAATSLFRGLGIARRLRGADRAAPPAVRRWRRSSALALTVAGGDDLRRRRRGQRAGGPRHATPRASRFGPTGPTASRRCATARSRPAGRRG